MQNDKLRRARRYERKKNKLDRQYFDGRKPKEYITGTNKADHFQQTKELDTIDVLKKQGYKERSSRQWSIIKRFLASRVGQKWDDVYSEICERFPRIASEEFGQNSFYVDTSFRSDGKRCHCHFAVIDGILQKNPDRWVRKKVKKPEYELIRNKKSIYIMFNTPEGKAKMQISEKFATLGEIEVSFARCNGSYERKQVYRWDSYKEMFVKSKIIDCISRNVYVKGYVWRSYIKFPYTLVGSPVTCAD